MIDPLAPLYVRAHDLAVATARHADGTQRLQARIADASLDLLEAVTHALSFPDQRAADLVRADRALAALRVHLRVAVALGVVSEGAQAAMAGEIVEAGRMLGGWQKSARTRARRGRASPPTGA